MAANGWFNAYGNAARKDNVDYFVHLGDYMYENGIGVVGKDPRATQPSDELFTLFDYRTRLGEYRTDLDLLLAHQNFAWIPVWDDHGAHLRLYCSLTNVITDRLQRCRTTAGVQAPRI